MTLTSQECGQLVNELPILVMQGRTDVERRGLDRLKVMAERCCQDQSLVLVLVGD